MPICVNDATFTTTAIAVMILLLVPMCIPLLGKIPKLNLGKVTSVVAGFAMAGVFAFFLPDLVLKASSVASRTEIAFFRDVEHLYFFIFSIFVAAFCVMYTLEKLAVERTKDGKAPCKPLFVAHMGIVCVMLILLVSSFPAMAETNFYAIGLICALTAFEIFLEEAAFTKHFGAIYSRDGRLIVTLAIVIGWLVGIKLFTHETTVFTLSVQAFVMGVILTAVVKREFDLITQQNNYVAFLVSVFLKLCLILGLMLLNDKRKTEAARVAGARATVIANVQADMEPSARDGSGVAHGEPAAYGATMTPVAISAAAAAPEAPEATHPEGALHETANETAMEPSAAAPTREVVMPLEPTRERAPSPEATMAAPPPPIGANARVPA